MRISSAATRVSCRSSKDPQGHILKMSTPDVLPWHSLYQIMGLSRYYGGRTVSRWLMMSWGGGTLCSHAFQSTYCFLHQRWHQVITLTPNMVNHVWEIILSLSFMEIQTSISYTDTVLITRLRPTCVVYKRTNGGDRVVIFCDSMTLVSWFLILLILF